MMYKYQDIIDTLSAEEISSVIDKLVKSYNLKGEFETSNFPWSNELKFMEFFSPTSEFKEIFSKTLQDEFDKEKYRLECKSKSLKDIDFALFDSSNPEKDLKNEIKEKIYSSLFNYIESKAMAILDNQEYLRIPVGQIIDFNKCELHNKYLNKIEFFKDGGWGIAEEDGTVLVKNHLSIQPSKSYSTFSAIPWNLCPYTIIQDRDTKKYGVLSYESFYEVIHCIYEKIEVIDYYIDKEKHFYIKAMKNGKWGCFDEKCALIIDFKYDIIRLAKKYIECIEGAEFLPYETFEANKENYVIKGKRYLFNNEGNLLIGGYDNIVVGYDYFLFYFGTSYEYYEKEERDFQGYPCMLSKIKLNYEKSKCLALDSDFQTFFKNKNGLFRLSKVHVIKSIEDLEKIVPHDILLRFQVDMSDICDSLIYLHDNYGENYIIPQYVKDGINLPFIDDNSNNSSSINGNLIISSKICDNQFDLFGDTPPVLFDNNKEEYIEDSVITIMMLNEKKEIAWIDYANEIEKAEYLNHIYRKGNKFGFFDGNGLKPALYDAITMESPDHKIYVASFEYCDESNPTSRKNPNYLYYKQLYIHYYKIDENGDLIKIEDDWNIFNPRECIWFPYDFIINNYGDCDDGAYDNFVINNEWTDEDAWDAMTDGMYGDYPGPGWDPELLGF